MLKEVQQYFTPEEAADFMRVSRRSIYSYLKSGKLKGTKTATDAWRISRDSMLEFLGVKEDEAKQE